MTPTSSYQFWQGVASSTGVIVQNSLPLVWIFLGILLAGLAVALIFRAFVRVAKRFR